MSSKWGDQMVDAMYGTCKGIRKLSWKEDFSHEDWAKLQSLAYLLSNCVEDYFGFDFTEE